MIIQQSGADVYVEAEINLLESPSGNAMKVILSGYETSTANSLANAVCESGKFTPMTMVNLHQELSRQGWTNS